MAASQELRNGAVMSGVSWVHPTARIGQGVEIGHGAIIGPNALISDNVCIGANVVVGESAVVGKGCSLRHNVTVEPCCRLGDGVVVEYNAVIKKATQIGSGTIIGANSVVGQVPSKGKSSTLSIPPDLPPLVIMDECKIGVGCVVYAATHVGSGCYIADGAQIRERCRLGRNVIIGRASTVENDCVIGDNTRIQAGVFIVALSVLEESVFVAPMVTTTNDNFVGRTEERFKHRKGVTVRRGGRIGANAVILPGVTIGEEALVAAGSVVTRDVPPYKIVMGVPAQVVRDVPPEQLIFPPAGVADTPSKS